MVSILLAAAILLAHLDPERFSTPGFLLPSLWIAEVLLILSGVAHSLLDRASRTGREIEATRFRLRERMKELNCIYEVFDSCRRADSPEELLQTLPMKIQAAMLNPQGCTVCIQRDTQPGDRPHPEASIRDEFIAPLERSDPRRGSLRVGYTTADRIMPEERLFLSLVAGMVGQILARLETDTPDTHHACAPKPPGAS